MRQEMAGVIESLHSRNDVHVCVVTGAGRGFCAGGDIRIMEELIRNGDFDRVQTFLQWGKAILVGIRTLSIPVIAAVNGPAAGAGMNLALACDFRIASDRATFGQAFVNIGLHPDWGGTYFLPRMAGPSRALEMFWTGRVIDAAEALTMGIVDMVVPHDDFARKVDELVQDLATRPRRVLALSKKNVYEGLENDLEGVLQYEASAQADCLRSDEALSGMRRFLKDKAARKPRE